MAVTYLEISYPNFVLGAIIDPEEANQNNHEFVEKINTTIELTNTNQIDIAELFSVKEDKTVVAALESRFQTHRTSIDHDGRYFTQTQLNDKFAASNQQFTIHKSSSDHDIRYYNKTLLDSGQLDTRYYTKEYLTPWLRGGDTNIKEEVFYISNSNNGDGTFMYNNGIGDVVGVLTESGGQVFTLKKGVYQLGSNRIEVIINDTLRRSVVSGGIQELSPTEFILTSPEGSGAEITVKYYERLGMSAEYNIKLSESKPPHNDGKTMWFEVI